MITRERHGPWALIVGGSDGIGEELAVLLAAAGINLALVARKPGPLETPASRIDKAGEAEVRTLSPISPGPMRSTGSGRRPMASMWGCWSTMSAA